MQCLFYGLPEWIDDPELRNRLKRRHHIPMIWDHIEPWYLEREKREIFELALNSPWAAGMVMTPLDTLSDPHLSARGYLGAIDTPRGEATGPIRPFIAPGLPVPDQRVRVQASDPAPAEMTRTQVNLRPFSDLRLIEMTISWAGPYVGNILAPLGIEVIKIAHGRLVTLQGKSRFVECQLIRDGTAVKNRHALSRRGSHLFFHQNILF